MTRSTAVVLEKESPAASSQSARTMSGTKSGGAGGKPARRAGRAEKGDEAFDVWLQRGLHQLYDSVAKEPIPHELLKLIEQDRSGRSE